MIALEGVSTRRAPLALANLSFAWEAGAHAIVGSRTDGGSLVLALLAGLAKPRAGRVTVLGGSPSDDAVRRQVALVSLEPALPEAMRVREVLALAAAVRREPARDEARRLATLGVEALVDRTVRSLSRSEARAVALVEAVTSANVRVLLLEDPLVAIDARAMGRVTEALRARARDGCVVVVTTGSMRDAGELADDLVTLRGSALAGRAASIDAIAASGTSGPEAGGARLRVVLRDAGAAAAFVAALAAALARDMDVESVERDEAAVRLRGPDAMALARAAGRAAVDAGVDVAELRLDVPAGLATGAPPVVHAPREAP
jgi:ABC-type multidrug transport system ATPase subunit